MYQAAYILKSMRNEMNFAAGSSKESAVFPLPVSGQNLISVYQELHAQAKKQRIYFPQTVKLSRASHYRIGKEAADSRIHPNWYKGKIELFEESLVDFYYGCTVKDLCRRYLVIQNPNSKNTYGKQIFIPKGMERAFCNYYRFIYCNQPYSPQNTVMIRKMPYWQENDS